MIAPAGSSVEAIRDRITSIEQRFEAVPASPQASTELVGDSATFDPFGQTYLAALRTRTGPVVPGPSAPGDVRATRVPAGVSAARSGMSDRVVAAINGVASTGASRPSGGYGTMPVPAELALYGNGRLPAEALTPISQSGHRLYAPAAAAWDAVVRAAAADGIELRITDSYRSYEQQVDLAARKGLYVNGGLAATPGRSNHGWGLAVDADLTDPAKLAWMREHGPRFGWVESVPREPWHWEFRPHQV